MKLTRLSAENATDLSFADVELRGDFTMSHYACEGANGTNVGIAEFYIWRSFAYADAAHTCAGAVAITGMVALPSFREWHSATEARLRFWTALPIRVHGTGPVKTFMSAIRHGIQVVAPIVCACMILVMHDFALLQRAPKLLTRDEPMLKHIPVFHGVRMVWTEDHSIAVRQCRNAALPFIIPGASVPVTADVADLVASSDSPKSATTRRELIAASTSAEHAENYTSVNTKETRP